MPGIQDGLTLDSSAQDHKYSFIKSMMNKDRKATGLNERVSHLDVILVPSVRGGTFVRNGERAAVVKSGP